jgi:hypothetical protein
MLWGCYSKIDRENKKCSTLDLIGFVCGTLLYLVFNLVHLCDLSWNQIFSSLRLIQSKLIDLGFEYYDGNIVISETETEGNQRHAYYL